MLSDSDGERELAMMSQPDVGSEDVMMEERMLATVSNAPNAAAKPQMYVSQCNKVYLGDRYISVTQKVRTTQEIKGQLLGLELVSANNSRKLRCSVAVFVCWALLVTIGLSSYIFRNAVYKKVTVIDLDIQEPWYLRRVDWHALPPRAVEFHETPLSYVFINSFRRNCTKKLDCIQKIRTLQRSHLDEARYDDISPNFLVTSNGLIFEGRGANVIGSVLKTLDYKSISIMFLGDYSIDKTNPVQFEHVDILLNQLVKQGILTPDYKLYGQCQLKTLTINPGRNLMQELKHFKHWNPENATLCLPR